MSKLRETQASIADAFDGKPRIRIEIYDRTLPGEAFMGQVIFSEEGSVNERCAEMARALRDLALTFERRVARKVA